MFLRSLTITSGDKVIREIEFRRGLNLIVDESENQITGNNVGKTTVLKLIDFCFGGDAKNIYTDLESKKTDDVVKDFLFNQKVLITLELACSIDLDDSENIIIERNFLGKGKEMIRRINGKQLTEDEFEMTLSNLIFPNHLSVTPSFRQIISHNIRYRMRA
jgi:uncharacterized protein YydD (DUF2326 family)